MFIVLTAILMISYAIIPVIAASAAPTSGAHKYKGGVVELLFLHCVLQSGYTMDICLREDLSTYVNYLFVPVMLSATMVASCFTASWSMQVAADSWQRMVASCKSCHLRIEKRISGQVWGMIFTTTQQSSAYADHSNYILAIKVKAFPTWQCGGTTPNCICDILWWKSRCLWMDICLKEDLCICEGTAFEIQRSSWLHVYSLNKFDTWWLVLHLSTSVDCHHLCALRVASLSGLQRAMHTNGGNRRMLIGVGQVIKCSQSGRTPWWNVPWIRHGIRHDGIAAMGWERPSRSPQEPLGALVWIFAWGRTFGFRPGCKYISLNKFDTWWPVHLSTSVNYLFVPVMLSATIVQ